METAVEDITGSMVGVGHLVAILVCIPVAFFTGCIITSILSEAWEWISGKPQKMIEEPTAGGGDRTARGTVEGEPKSQAEVIAAEDSMGSRVIDCEESYALGRDHFWRGRSHQPPAVLGPGQKIQWLNGWVDAEESCHEYNENYGKTTTTGRPKADWIRRKG